MSPAHQELFYWLRRIPQPPKSYSAATTLKAAVRDRAAQTARHLVAKGVDTGDLQGALLSASLDGEMLGFVFEAAVAQDAQLDFREALESAARYGEADVVRRLREHAPASQDLEWLDGVTPVRHIERVEWLRGDAKQEAVRRMCEIISGAALDEHLETPSEHGLPPLVEAARRGVGEVVDALLDRGADPNRQVESEDFPDRGRTALMIAAERGDRDMVARLLRAGANPNLRDGHGSTALMEACADPVVVRQLLAAGSDFRIVTNDGSSALKAACGIFKEEIRQILEGAHRAARAGKSGEGVRFVQRKLGSRLGSRDFQDVLANRPWSVVAVRAAIEEVTTTYAESRGAARREHDIVDRDMKPAEEWAHVVQLRDDAWTVVLRTLGRWCWGDRYRTGQEGLELSTFLSTDTVAATFDGEKCTYEIYHEGSCLEEARWERDGELLFFRGARRKAAESFGTSWDDFDAFFGRQGIFLPPAKLDVDGMQIRLELHGLESSDVERVDLLVFEDQPAVHHERPS